MEKQQKEYFAGLEEDPRIAGDIPDAGCVVSDRISVDGCGIGVMYRDIPIPDTTDSGWVFLAGDEDDVYMNTPGNNAVFSLSTICNYDPSVIPFLDADYETAFLRNEEGEFVQDEEFFGEEN